MQLAVRNMREDVGRRVDVALAADKRFDRYGPMKPETVRTADVQGTEIEKLRARREMLLSMDPETAKQVIEFHRDLNFFQALALAQKEGKLIVPNDVHDRILTETHDEKYLRANYPVWTGTLVIYEKPDKPFGDQIVFRRKEDNKIKYSVTFEIPEQFRGKVNCALALDYLDFELMSLGNNIYEIKLANEANIHLIQAFPKKDGWYIPHPETMIPLGEQVAESREARRLWRLATSYIGPVARGYNNFYDNGRQDVDLDFAPSVGFGVALF